MKNLNPKSGLKQISSGKLYLPRRLILEFVLNKKIKLNELSYYIIALVSADWTNEEYRFGFIRHETKKLSEIWDIPYSTLLDNFNKLVANGLLGRRQGVYFINDFVHFAKASGKYANKNVTTDGEIELIFKKLFLESEISDYNQSANSDFHKIPYKVKHKIASYSPISITRTDADYQRIYAEGNYSGLTPDDMKWLDDHIDEHGRYLS